METIPHGTEVHYPNRLKKLKISLGAKDHYRGPAKVANQTNGVRLFH